jgi:kynurenine formamidase
MASGSVAQNDCLEWMREVAARRRFGDKDRRGTAHLIDARAQARALAAMSSGTAVSLARPLVPTQSVRGDGRPGFAMKSFCGRMGHLDVGTDHVELDCHGSTATHLDGLNHVGLDGTWYSGWPLEEMDACSVEEFATSPIFTRAVLADIPSARQTEWVAADEPVTGADIDAALRAVDVAFEPGDALLLYMGRDRYESVHGNYAPYEPGAPERAPGIGRHGAEWVLDHDVSVLAWDFQDAHHPDEPPVSVHGLIWATGQLIVDNSDFSRLVPRARETKQHVGALVLASLFIPGATGSVVNPLVVL